MELFSSSCFYKKKLALVLYSKKRAVALAPYSKRRAVALATQKYYSKISFIWPRGHTQLWDPCHPSTLSQYFTKNFSKIFRISLKFPSVMGNAPDFWSTFLLLAKFWNFSRLLLLLKKKIAPALYSKKRAVALAYLLPKNITVNLLFDHAATRNSVIPPTHAPSQSHYIQFQWLSLLPTWMFEGARHIYFLYVWNK